MPNQKKSLSKYILFIAILGLSGFTLFSMYTTPIYLWDEALFSLRAVYMWDTGSYMYNFNEFQGIDSHENTKMPFFTFIQSLFIGILGYESFALRLPVWMVFCLTMWWFYKHAKYFTNVDSRLLAHVFLLVLLSSHLWNRPHILMSGDQDAPFSCFLFISLLSFYLALEHPKKPRYILWFTFGLWSALMIKNILALVLGLGILIYIGIQRKWITVFRDVKWYASMFFIIVSYLGLLYYYNGQSEGFLQRMWDYELMGRFNQVKENTGPWYMYIHQITIKYNTPFFIFSLLNVLLLFFKRFDQFSARLSVFSWCMILPFLVFISLSETKTLWYDAAIVPFFLLTSAITIHYILQFIRRRYPAKFDLMQSAFVILLFSYPSYNQIQFSLNQPFGYPSRKMSPFIEKLEKDKLLEGDMYIADPTWGFSSSFYIQKYNAQGLNMSLTKRPDTLHNVKVILCDQTMKSMLEKEKKDFLILTEALNTCAMIEVY